ncbi:PAS domain S-box protein [uncultured Jatrophihabitans sp.]|uniref:sensor histidine kinase n=1 Tax=uncultured Jatrophihabitans sp. TaxID=1610747 RepID=UPI0035C9C7EE
MSHVPDTLAQATPPIGALLGGLLDPDSLARAVDDAVQWTSEAFGARAVRLVAADADGPSLLHRLGQDGFGRGATAGLASDALPKQLLARWRAEPSGSAIRCETTDPVDGSPATLLLVPLRTADRARYAMVVQVPGVAGFDAAALGQLDAMGLLISVALARAFAIEQDRQRAQLDRLLTTVSTDLIRFHAGGMEAAIREAMGSVAQFVGAAHAHAFVTGQLDVHWHMSGASPEPGDELGAGVPDGWLARLADGPFLAAGDGTAADALVLPLRADGEVIGRVVLVAGPRARWDGALALTLRQLGGMISQVVTSERLGRQLAASEARYRSVVEQVRDVIVRIDGTGKIVFVNRAWTELTGLTIEETLTRTPFDSIHPDDHAVAAAHLASVVAGEDRRERGVRFVAKDGSHRWMEIRGRAMFDAAGGFDGLSGVLHDVTERQRAQDRAQQALDDAVAARDEAQRTSRRQAQFLSRMSHELRTPLNAILGFAQLLEYSSLDEEGLDAVRLIRQGGHHLRELIDDVMDISRVQSGEFALSPEAVDVAEVWSECVGLLAANAAAMEVDVADLTRDGAAVQVDRRRFKQIMLNVLSNAIKYNKQGGQVHIDVRPAAAAAGDRTVVAISDTGVGVRSDQLGALFAPFERLGAELTQIEGTGVGLALTKTLVEAMGGTITVASEPQIGTTMSIALPPAAVGAP